MSGTKRIEDYDPDLVNQALEHDPSHELEPFKTCGLCYLKLNLQIQKFIDTLNKKAV